jgi:hypothetical protein
MSRMVTLAKLSRFYNLMRRLIAVFILGLLNLYAIPAVGDGIEVTLVLEQLINQKREIVFEAAEDSGFSSIVSTVKSPNHTVTWRAPREGVYHWRVSADVQPSSQHSVEVSAIASGSIIVLNGKGALPDPVEIRWTQESGVSTSLIDFSLKGETVKTFYSAKPNLTFFRLDAPFVVRIAPHRRAATKRQLKNQVLVSRLDSGLAIVRKDLAAIVPAPEPVPDAPKPEFIPLPPAPPAIDLMKDNDDGEDLASYETRSLEVLLGIYAAQDRLYAAKSGVNYTSKLRPSGAFGSLKVIPAVGLELMASASAHGAEAKWKSTDGRADVVENVSLYLAEVGAGFDTFLKNPNRRHRLTLEVRGAIAGLPHLPVNEEDLGKSGFVSTDLQMVGLGSSYRWSVKRWSVGLEAVTYMQSADRSGTNDAALEQWSGFVSFDPVKSLTMRASGFSRLTRVVRCSASAAVCDRDGSAATRSAMVGGGFSLGYVLN